MNNKIKTIDEVIDIVEKLKKEGKKTVLSLGIFDVIHPGVITHLRLAKNQGDILIASVIKNKDVKRGPSRPIFDEGLRAENVASIEYVDYVCLVDDNPPFECLKVIKPDIFAKGKDYKDRPEEISAILKYKEDAIKIAGCKVHFTSGTTISSTHIINQFLDVYPQETRRYLNRLSCKYNIFQIIDMIENTKNLSVLIIGDGIIDEYHYCESMGKSAKDHLVVSRYLSKEVFAGGTFAIANHTASVCKNVHLITLLGNDDTREDFILDKLKPNITYKFFYRDDGPTIIKRRFVNQYLNQKIFEVCYMNNDKIKKYLEEEILEYLTPQLQKYDLVMVADFGHGFITDDIIRLIESK
ncbi:TPA: hypothetical protein DCX16_00560, partial [bacterium]|nr:hypothetical protein [bacterium]